MIARLSISLVLLAAAGCADSLPQHDRRIRIAPPVAKMSADDLWKEFQADAAAAHRTYWGRAVEISGKVTRADPFESGTRYVFFGQGEVFGVTAFLLEDDAAEVLKAVTPGQRLTLKCFCEGLDGNLILKSCIRP